MVTISAHRVDQASAKLVSQVKKLKDGPYKGASDKRPWSAVEREIVEHLNKASLNIARVHLLYLLECLDEQLNNKMMNRLGADNFLDSDQVELLYTMWNLFDQMFRSEYAPEAESDKMEAIKKSVKESLPEFLYRLQSIFFSVEIETSTEMIDATKLTKMRSALPEADVQFLREHFQRGLSYDALVTRVTEYFSNPLDRKQYETFIRNYNSVWRTDKTAGFSNAEFNLVDANEVGGDKTDSTSSMRSIDSSQREGVKLLQGSAELQSSSVTAESIPQMVCLRCGKSGHTSVNCMATFVKRSNRCFNCGKPGHVAAYCSVPRNMLKCKRCGQVGHVSWMCKKPWATITATRQMSEKTVSPEVPQPQQPVGNYTTKMVYETTPSTTEDKSSVAGGGSEKKAESNSKVANENIEKAATIRCEAQAVSEMQLEDGFLTATFDVYSPHELITVKGLLDTGASVGFIRDDFAESLVSHGAGYIVGTPAKVKVKLADGTVRYLDKAWKCFVKQATKQGEVVWKLLVFILMDGVGKPGIIIGRNQFKSLGFSVTRTVICNDDQHCVLNGDKVNTSEELPDGISVCCQHAHLLENDEVSSGGRVIDSVAKGSKVYETKLYNGRIAALDWKSKARPPRSYHAAVKRAERLEYSLRKRGGPQLLEKYDEQFQSWLKSGFIRPVSDDEVKHYLFHHPVLRIGHPTTPVRPVINGQSLDPYLKSTECSLLRISNILLKWRQVKKWATMDLSKAFLRIQMRDCDQPYLGIYWRGQSYLFNVLPFGLAMSPSWLMANVREVLYRLSKQAEFESVVLPYMDDLLLLVGDGQDIIAQQHALVERFEKDGFPVAVPKTVWYTQMEPAKVLGTTWLGAEKDALKPGFKSPSTPPTTRRSVLAMLNSLFDPLGFLLELSMKGRLLMRAISTYDWDTELPESLCKEANNWLGTVQKAVETTAIPRFVDCKRVLVYVDASQTAWGVDIRSTDGVRILAKGGLFEKERMSKWSIVRKELLALVHGRECLQELWSTIDPKLRSECKAVFLSDSQINCYRLHKGLQSKDMKAWERKTVDSLRGFLLNFDITLRHIDTGWNTADAISRGYYPNTVNKTMIVDTANWWVNGDYTINAPWGPSVDFTHDEYITVTTRDDISEDKVKSENETLHMVSTISSRSQTLDDIILKHKKLLSRLRAWKAKTCHDEAIPVTDEHAWVSKVKLAQASDHKLNIIIASLKNDESSDIDKHSKRLWNSQYTLDQNSGLLYRVVRQDTQGKIHKQLVLPKGDPLTTALIERYHRARLHGGALATLQSLLEHYWWKGMGKQVRIYVNGCDICRLVKGKASAVLTPGLRKIIPSPWYLVGADITGPYPESSTGYKYLLTVTCLYSRFMSVKPLRDITAQSVSNAFMEICKLFGAPTILVTDNGKQFISKLFSECCTKLGITHKLIPRYSPHLGGGYERPHQLLHRALRSCLLELQRSHQGSVSSWFDLLPDVLWVINSRKLRDGTESMSPFELMMVRPPRFPTISSLERLCDDVCEIPSVADLPKPPSNEMAAVQRKKQRKQLRKEFQHVWENLRERSRLEQQSKASKSVAPSLAVGDLVFISKPRKHKLDVGWRGPYPVKSIQGVKVIVEVEGREVVDSVSNVLKLTNITTSTQSGKRSVLPSGSIVLFGDLEAGWVLEGSGQDLLIQMLRLKPLFKHTYEVRPLYWNSTEGSIESFPLSNRQMPTPGEDIGVSYVPLMRSRCFPPKGRNVDWVELNIRPDGVLTRRSTQRVEEWQDCKSARLCDAELNNSETISLNLEASLCSIEVVPRGSDWLDQFLGSVLSNEEITESQNEILQYEITESNCDKSHFSEFFPLPNCASMVCNLTNKQIRELFEKMIQESVQGSWVSVLVHYSIRAERSALGVNALFELFDNEKFTGSNVHQANSAELNAAYKQSGEQYLPACVIQLRRTGLDGTEDSRRCLKDFKVTTPLVDPSVCATVVAISMATGCNLKDAVDKFLKATSGLCLGQCWLCPPSIHVDEEGKQLASTRVRTEDRGSHMHTLEHKKSIHWLLWYGMSFYSVLQATAEGMRLGMSMQYSELDTEYWQKSRDNNWVLAKGQLYPIYGSLSCILCDKFPSSRLKITEHFSGGYNSVKPYQHFYFVLKELQGYTGTRDRESVYCEGRPAALSNAKCVKTSQWQNYWQSMVDAEFGLTQAAFIHLRPEVESVFRAVLPLLGYDVPNDLRNCVIRPADLPAVQTVNMSWIYHNQYPDDENPEVDPEYLSTTDDEAYESARQTQTLSQRQTLPLSLVVPIVLNLGHRELLSF